MESEPEPEPGREPESEREPERGVALHVLRSTRRTREPLTRSKSERSGGSIGLM
jgi:hypothetical protein